MTAIPVYVIVFDIFAFLSMLIFAISIVTAICSKRLYRGKGWFGMMTYWLVVGLCFAQTVFIYAAPPLVAVGTLCFYLDFYLGNYWDPTYRRSLRPGIGYFILVLPWLVHVAIDIEVIVIGLTTKTEPVVERIESTLFCHFHDNSHPGLVNAVIVVLSMALLVPLEVWTGIQLYRSRSIRAGEDFRQYLSVYLRIAACTVVAAAAFGAITLADSTSDSLVQDLSFPCLSMAVSLIFASQQDMVNVWLCRPPRYSGVDTNVMRSMDRPPSGELKPLRNRRALQASELSDFSRGSSLPPGFFAEDTESFFVAHGGRLSTV